MICVDLAGVTLAQPDKVLFRDLSVTVSTGDRVAVVGVNGSGKTTLLKIMTGVLTPDAGDVRFGRGVRIASLEQDPVLPAGTVGEFLGDSWEVAAVATKLGVQPLLDRRTDELSGGQAKRVALAKVLADDEHGDHDLVVLDEPTNHLDLEAIEWLESRLVTMKSALVLVTHDRHALDRLTTDVGPSKVVELEGRTLLRPSSGCRGERLREPTSTPAPSGSTVRCRRSRPARSSPARNSPGCAAARRLDPPSPRPGCGPPTRSCPAGRHPSGVRGSELQLGGGTARLGNQVVELEGVAQRFDVGGAEELTVFEHVDLLIEPGARLAVVGPNGSGKSTLLDIIAGRTQPAAGTVKRGKTVVVGFADQHSSDLDPNAVVRELVAGPHREPDHRDRALLERFWFDTTAQLRAGADAVGWGAPPPAARDGARDRAEPADPRRADQRPRPRHAAIAGGVPRRLAGRARRRQPRPGLPRPGRRPRPRHRSGRIGAPCARWRLGVAGGAVRRDRAPSSPHPLPSRRRRQPPAARRKASSGPSPSTIGRQLRETEQAMVKAQKRVDQLTERLATIDHSTVDHTEFTTIGTELAGAQAELDALESRWLELAELQST